MTMRKSRNATRRSRNRRGSRRVVRRNKTMKGGMLGMSMPGVTKTDFMNSGYKFAVHSLTNNEPEKLNDILKISDKIKKDYSDYWNKAQPNERTILIYKPNVSRGVFSKVAGFASNLVGIPGATPTGTETKQMLTPANFNSIMDKIKMKWVDTISNGITGRVLTSTNQSFVDFGLSYTKLMKVNNAAEKATQNPQTNTGSNPATSAASAADNVKGMIGSFAGKFPGVGSVAGKFPGVGSVLKR